MNLPVGSLLPGRWRGVFCLSGDFAQRKCAKCGKFAH
nr:MAG TPA: zinc knuckle protein [Caudoviricetes sp.]